MLRLSVVVYLSLSGRMAEGKPRPYVHIYIHTYLHTYIQTYTHIVARMSTYIHTYLHTYLHIRTLRRVIPVVCVTNGREESVVKQHN